MVGYGINPTAFNEKFPFLEQAVQSDVTEKIKVLTSPGGVDLLTAPFTRPDEIDYTLVEDKIMTLLNELRLEQGLLPSRRTKRLKRQPITGPLKPRHHFRTPGRTGQIFTQSS